MKAYKKIVFDDIDDALNWLNSNDKSEYKYREYINHNINFNLISVIQIDELDWEDKPYPKIMIIFTSEDSNE